MNPILSLQKIILLTFAILLWQIPNQSLANENVIPISSEKYNCEEYFEISYDFINLDDNKTIIEQGEKLLASGYHDKRIYHHVATAYYKLGNTQAAIKALIESTKQQYLCGTSIFPGSERGLVIDYVMEHYHLFELLTELGETKRANHHLAKAEEILKNYYKDDYSDRIRDKIFRTFSFKK